MTIRFTVGVLLLSYFIVNVYANSAGPVQPNITQPLPCSLSVNASVCENGQFGDNCKCIDAFPSEALGFEGVCGEDGVWRPADDSGDLFVLADQLVDFCRGVFEFTNNLVIPPSSNISVYRNSDGSSELNGRAIGQIRSTSGAIFNYGYLFVVLPFSNEAEESEENLFIPKNGTVFVDIFAANKGFDLANRTEFWQNNFPFIQCQTIENSPIIAQNASVANGGNSTLDFANVLEIELCVFDQCSHDYDIFVIVMGTVGGAILLGSAIWFVLMIINAIKESKEQHSQQPTYIEMER